MRKKFSIDAKKVFAFEMTAPLETEVRGTSLYKPYRYVPLHCAVLV